MKFEQSLGTNFDVHDQVKNQYFSFVDGFRSCEKLGDFSSLLLPEGIFNSELRQVLSAITEKRQEKSINKPDNGKHRLCSYGLTRRPQKPCHPSWGCFLVADVSGQNLKTSQHCEQRCKYYICM